MVEWQVSQPQADRVSNQNYDAENSLVQWDASLSNGSHHQTCRIVGDTIVCSDAFDSNTKVANNENNAFRAILPLQQAMGWGSPTELQRVSDSQPLQGRPYYAPAAQPDGYYQADASRSLSSATAIPQGMDAYSFNQGPRIGAINQTAPGPVDQYSYNQGDRTSGNPGFIPPYIKPNGHEVPQPPIQAPRPVEVPQPPKPGDVTQQPRPGEVPPPPRPMENQQPCTPRPMENQQPCAPRNYQPCRPCQPCGPRWYPGKIAVGVLGRVFGGRRCH